MLQGKKLVQSMFARRGYRIVRSESVQYRPTSADARNSASLLHEILPVVQPNAPGGFGADDLRAQSAERFNPNRNGVSEVSVQVAQVTERQPGTYLVTLSNGAQWLFAESVSSNYRAPRRGQTVSIERGALGGYMMVVDRQQGVRVTRVK